MNELFEGLTITTIFLKIWSKLKKRILRGKRLEDSVDSLQGKVSELEEEFRDIEKGFTDLKEEISQQINEVRKTFEEQSFVHIEINGTIVSVPKGKSKPFYCTMCKGIPLKQFEYSDKRYSHFCPSCNEPYGLR